MSTERHNSPSDDGYPAERDLARMVDDGGPLEPTPTRIFDGLGQPPPARAGRHSSRATPGRQRPARSVGPAAATEATRRDAFAALVAVQDRGLSVARSREDVARRFGLSLVEVGAIEKEGLYRQWPPLGGVAA